MRRNTRLEARFSASESQVLWLVPQNRSERQVLRRHIGAGCVREPYPGMFGRATTCAGLNPRAIAYRTLRTLARIHPTWTFCSFSAAVLLGIHVPWKLLGSVHIAVGPKQFTTNTGVLKRHVCTCPPILFDGYRTTSINQTVMDCLCTTSFRDGLAIADSALHWYLTASGELTRYMDAHGAHRKGIRQARQTLAWASDQAENGGESQLRAIIIEEGFATPELQVEIPDPMGTRAFVRVDMLWRSPSGRLIICEFDGLDKYLGAAKADRTIEHVAAKLSDERSREAHINLIKDAIVIRVTSRDLNDPAYIVSPLGHAGVPRRSSDSALQSPPSGIRVPHSPQ